MLQRFNPVWMIVIILLSFCTSVLASPPELVRLENDYIAIIVNPGPESLGRFTIEVTGGDPGRDGDDHKPLTYGRPKPWTSFTTVQIDGENYVFGGRSDTRAGRNANYGRVISGPEKSGDKILTLCELGKIRVIQTLSFVKSNTTGLYDTAQIKYTLINNDTQQHKVGLRILLDTMLAENDGAPFRVNDQAILSDRLFVKGDMPAFWQAFDMLSRPQVIAQGTIEGPNVVTPDKIYFSNWGSMADGLWEFDFRPGRDFTRAGEFELDSAVALYWAPRFIAPGDSMTIITNFGLGGITLVPGLLSVGVTSPAQVVLEHEKTTFPVIAYVQNTSGITAKKVKVELKLPDRFILVRGQKIKELGDLPSQEIFQVAWEIMPPASEVPSEMKYQVEVTAENTDSNFVERMIDFIGPPHIQMKLVAPEQLKVHKHKLEPNPFKVEAVIENSGESTAYEVASKLILPPGLDYAPREKAEKLLGDIKAGEKIEVPWLVEVLGGTGQLPYALELKGINIPDLSEVRFLSIPQIKTGLFFGQPEGDYQQGSTISIPVLIGGLKELKLENLRFNLQYDPEVLEYIRCSRGRLFVRNNRKLEFYQPEITPGMIKGLGGSLPEQLPETGVITTVHFLVKKAQETTLKIELEGNQPSMIIEQLILMPQNN